MPRPVHPKRDIAARNAFKKNDFPHAVKKATRAAARRGRRLRIMCADEARLCRGNRPRPCGAPIGIGPRSPRGSFANTSICMARSLRRMALASIRFSTTSYRSRHTIWLSLFRLSPLHVLPLRTFQPQAGHRLPVAAKPRECAKSEIALLARLYKSFGSLPPFAASITMICL
jgi:hypothetical protein